jgi:hypothetical protein
MKENGKMANIMEQVSTHGLIKVFIQGSSKMATNTARVYINPKMEEYLKVYGKMVKEMEEEG